nr:hypothetical protein [uncultured Albidiferax sp.]
MKQEVKDIVVQVAASSPTSIYAIFSGLTVAEWVAITLGVLQAMYLVRKWWREESEWGVRLKRWAENKHTRPGDL